MKKRVVFAVFALFVGVFPVFAQRGRGGGVLSAPTLTVQTTSSSKAILSWTAVRGAAGYNLYASQNPSSGFVFAKNYPATTTSEHAYNIPANTTLYFRIAAYASDATQGAVSNTASLTASGVGNAVQSKPKLTIQNNTGNDVGLIEVKLSASSSTTQAPIWTTVFVDYSTSNGDKQVITIPQLGTYDIRVRNSTGFAIMDYDLFFVKKNVKVTNGMTLSFTQKDLYTLKRADYQEIIEDRCKFAVPKDVWMLIDKHPRADFVYQTWVRSYPGEASGIVVNGVGTRPRNRTDVQIILDYCKFNRADADNLWKLIRQHKSADDLLRLWADSYFSSYRSNTTVTQ